jgi:hypothetical protein
MKKIMILLILSNGLLQVAAQENKDEFNPHGKVTSQVFGDYYYVALADTGADALQKAVLNKLKNANGFVFRRANLGYEQYFTKKFFARICMESDGTSVFSDGRAGIYLKDAYIRWEFCELTSVWLGLQPTFSFETSEKYWGFRCIERTIMDQRGFAASRDFGISVRGKFSERGNLYYNLLAANNNYLKPETDRFKRVYANIGYKPAEFADIIVYSDYGFRAKEKDKTKDEILSGLFTGIKKEKYSAGLELIYHYGKNAWKPDTIEMDKSSFASSLFGSYSFTKKISVFVRYDFYNDNIDEDADGDIRHFAIAGFSWSPAENIMFSPNVMTEFYEKSGSYSPAPSVWPRITFFWQLK